MKLTRILPKPLAIFYQEYDLNRTDGELEYYKAMVRVLEERSHEGHEELGKLKEETLERILEGKEKPQEKKVQTSDMWGSI